MTPAALFGKSIAFPPRIGADGRVAFSEGETNVQESLRIILLTELKERLRLPEFGCGLGHWLFEPNNVGTRRQIQEAIIRALARWEPRVRVQSVSVEPDAGDPEAAVVSIDYQLVATQARQRVSVNLTFGGGR